VKEYHVERLMRDAKITQIYEGTSSAKDRYRKKYIEIREGNKVQGIGLAVQGTRKVQEFWKEK
jgi:hypothetical protein